MVRPPEDPDAAVRWALEARPYDGFDLPEGAYPAVERALSDIGHHRYISRPGMVLDLTGWTPPEPPAVEIVRADIERYAAVQQEAFDDPHEISRALGTRWLRAPGTRVLLGLVDGEPVSTAVGVDVGDTVGIFGVATRKEHRGKGYGTALTAAAIGTTAKLAWLQASEDGYPVYQRMGFRDLGDWVVWTG